MKKELLMLIGSMAATFSYAQEIERDVVATSGKHLENTTAQWSFTIGDPFTQTMGTSDFILSQGFQQSEVEVALGFDYQPSVEMKVYPNPATDRLKLETQDFSGLQYQLLDFNGRQLQRGLLTEQSTSLDVRELSSGTYLLTVQDMKLQKVKTYTIIKK